MRKKRGNPSLLREYRVFYVKDVMEILGVGQSKAYQIMRRINNELEADGFVTIAGRVSAARFKEKFYVGIPRQPREEKDSEQTSIANSRARLGV